MKPTKPKLLPNEVPKPDPLVGMFSLALLLVLSDIDDVCLGGIDSSELIQAGIPTEIISELVNYALFFKEELHKYVSYAISIIFSFCSQSKCLLTLLLI